VIGAAIYLYHPTERALKCSCAADGRFLRPLRLKRNLPARGGACLETSEDRVRNRSRLQRSFVSVPLVLQQDSWRALSRASNRVLEYAVIHTLARQLGIALENARLYGEVQEKEQLRGECSNARSAAQEEERKRIARELHRRDGQLLTALAVGLGGVEQTIAARPDRAQYQIAELKNMTMAAIDSLRQFVSDLRPSVLDDMGLSPLALVRGTVRRAYQVAGRFSSRRRETAPGIASRDGAVSYRARR